MTRYLSTPGRKGAISVILLVLAMLAGLTIDNGPARAATQPVIRTDSPESGAAVSLPSAEPVRNASPAPDDDDDDDEDGEDVDYEEFRNGSAKNYVIVLNKKDERFRIRAKVQLNQIQGDRVTSENFAGAGSQCVDCKTMAVALQINLYRQGASHVAPVNQAIAYNYQCTRCMTKARAIQYALPVDDPAAVPSNVDRLIREMNRELREIAKDARSGDVTFADAEHRVNAVIGQFHELAWSLSDQRDEKITPDAHGGS
jgi:hypothetical protein